MSIRKTAQIRIPSPGTGNTHEALTNLGIDAQYGSVPCVVLSMTAALLKVKDGLVETSGCQLMELLLFGEF
jgi:hypothetical protein